MTILETEIGKIIVPDTFPEEWIEEGVIYAVCMETGPLTALAIGWTVGSIVEFSGVVRIPISRAGTADAFAVLKGGKVTGYGLLENMSRWNLRPGDVCNLDIAYHPGFPRPAPDVTF